LRFGLFWFCERAVLALTLTQVLALALMQVLALALALALTQVRALPSARLPQTGPRF
jgi:hypothetical protein